MLERSTLLLISVILSWQYGVFAQEAPPQKSIPQDAVIELKRFADAFGNGDEYRLKITANGAVVFERFKDFKIATTIKGKISCKKLAQLISEFEKIDYFSLKDRYKGIEDGCPEVWTDQAYAVTSIKINGKSKSINHYYGCMEGGFKSTYPRMLTELEMKIDEIVGTKQWLK